MKFFFQLYGKVSLSLVIFIGMCQNLLVKLYPENTRPNEFFIIVDDLKPLLGYGSTLAKTQIWIVLFRGGLCFGMPSVHRPFAGLPGLLIQR